VLDVDRLAASFDDELTLRHAATILARLDVLEPVGGSTDGR